MKEADVTVIGAGPAGAAAAITLRRAGCEVALVDKAAFPRDKCCGDGLTTSALRLVEALGVRPGAVESWQRVAEVIVCSPSGREVTLPLPEGGGTYAAVARRWDLDAALVDRARAWGAEVLEGDPLREASFDESAVTISTQGRSTISSAYVIGADGMWSPLRKALGSNGATYLGEWHAARQYFTEVGPRAAACMWVWFEPDVLPGYVWSFPLRGGRANVGFGITRRAGRSASEMGELWTELLRRPHIARVLGPQARPEAGQRSWPIPAREDSLAGAGGRVLFAGDAARVADPMTGEGIAQALETGILAARAILSHPREPAMASRAYGDAVRNGMGHDNAMASMLSRMLASPSITRGALRAVGASAWTRRSFARWMMEDYPRALLLTPRRWTREHLHRDGGYSDLS